MLPVQRVQRAHVFRPALIKVVDGLFSDPSSQDQGKWMLDLFQPDLSHTVRKEIDPLEWTELIGSVGGTWGESDSLCTQTGDRNAVMIYVVGNKTVEPR